MASFKRAAGGWQAKVAIKGTREAKTHPTKAEAMAWAAELQMSSIGRALNLAILTLPLFFSAALAAPRKPASVPATTAEELTPKARDKMISDAQAFITENLKDPKSAKFRKSFTSPKMLSVCGEVNAKNSMGGYVGFRRFIVAKDKTGIEDDGSSFVEANWHARCEDDVIY